jgi:transposase
MAYSEDYRKRAIEYYETHSQKELYEAFRIYASEVNKWKKLLAKTGTLKPRYPKTRVKKIDLKKLAKAVEEKPGAYLKEHAAEFECTKQAVHYAMKRLKITNKKNVCIP